MANLLKNPTIPVMFKLGEAVEAAVNRKLAAMGMPSPSTSNIAGGTPQLSGPKPPAPKAPTIPPPPMPAPKPSFSTPATSAVTGVLG